MSLSGANADHRVPCTPADQKNILAYIHDRLIGGSEGSLSYELKPVADKAISALKDSGSKGVLVSGIEDTTAQVAVLLLTLTLTVKLSNPIKIGRASCRERV